MESENQQRVEALNARAVNCARSGQTLQAEQLWSQALQLDPDAIAIRSNLARLFFQLGRFQSVLNLTDGLNHESPVPAALAALIGQAALRCGLPALALRWLSTAERARPNEPSLLLSMSEALLASGLVDRSVALLNDLVNRYPDALEPRLNLAIAKTESGTIGEAATLYDSLLSHWSEHPAVLLNAARFHCDYGDRNLARRLVEDLIRVDPQSRAARLLLADLCFHGGQLEQAQGTWQMLLELDPMDQEAYLPLIFTALDQQDWNAAAKQLQQAFSHCQGQSLTRLLAAWFDLPPDIREAYFPQWSTDPLLCVQQHQLIQPDDPLLMQWITWLKADSSLIVDRPGKPTVGGMQSHELFNRIDDRLSQCLTDRLSPVVSTYRQELRNHSPLFASLSGATITRFSGWGVVLRQGGKQIRHTHPEAEISGVLYLSIPANIGFDDTSNEGALWFSPNPCYKQQIDGLTVIPKPGLLVLFPSFLPHETIPFVSEEDRICIAFNVS